MKKLNFMRLLGVFAISGMLMFVACKKDPDPVVPDFGNTFEDPEIPDVVDIEPEAVESTEAELEESAAASAANDALAKGEVTPELESATTTISALVSTDEADELSTALAGGTLSAAQQAQLDKILASGALDAFMPKVTAPTVNGAVVASARKSGVKGIDDDINSFKEMFLGVADECTDALNVAYNTAKAKLDASKKAQDDAINAAYNTRVTVINNTAGTDITAKWTAQKTAAASRRDNSLAGVNTGVSNETINAGTATLLRLVIWANYGVVMGQIETAQNADAAAQNQSKALKLQNAESAKNASLAAVVSNFASLYTSLETTRTQSYTTCHDQGFGN